jgi:type IV secretion system protein VirB9
LIHRVIASLFAIIVLFAAPALARQDTSAPGDRRIRVIPYDPDQVINLVGHLGYQIMVEFGADEQIENVSIGDSLGWQVTPNRRATLLFLKPLELDATTNMTVVTSQRRYAFTLSADEVSGPSDPALVYTLRFSYPPPPIVIAEPVIEPEPPPPEPVQLNFNYSFSGSRSAAPARVFDDGVFTYFQFAPDADAPAIFVIGADGEEELVNAQARNGSMVIDRIARTFVLRYGKERTQVFNDAFVTSPAEIDGPRPRDSKSRRKKER